MCIEKVTRVPGDVSKTLVELQTIKIRTKLFFVCQGSKDFYEIQSALDISKSNSIQN